MPEHSRFHATDGLVSAALVLCRDVRVMFSTTISESLRSSLAKLLKRLGGKDVGKDSLDFTHFVTIQPSRGHKTLGFKKSFNTLLALAAGEST